MWGICLKRYEKEAFAKSFLLFFGIQLIFLAIIMFQHYQKLVHQEEMHISAKMMQCALGESCEGLQVSMVHGVKDTTLHKLHVDRELWMLTQCEGHYNKITFGADDYQRRLDGIQKEVFWESLLYLAVLLAISALFSYYALQPLEKALKLNEEFVKDMLHDFNTPLATLKINFKLLQKKFGSAEELHRAENAISKILDLQSNLHYYLNRNVLSRDEIVLDAVVNERIERFKELYPDLGFHTRIAPQVLLFVNKEAFLRILDNLLSNACKYNNAHGSVSVELQGHLLHIKDTGIGIKHPEQVFDRYYREHERGIGIGLHIVKKLCDEVHIRISLKSEQGHGSVFTLDLEEITQNKGKLYNFGDSEVTDR